MRKEILLISLLSLAFGASAAPVSPQRAIEIASEYSGGTAGGRRETSASKDKFKIVYTRTAKTAGQANFYAVGHDKQPGFVLVAGDDRLPAVLGYSATGKFSEASMPPSMREMFDNWDAQIAYLLAHPEVAMREPVKVAAVAPLLGEIAWDQTAPYNAKCPTVKLFDDWGDPAGTGPAATGCVATAVGQIMYYHQWPTVGKGTVSYTSEGEDDRINIDVTFEGTAYDWASMLPSLSNDSPAAAIDAVSTLLYHVGAGLESVYGAATGALDISVAPALTNYFGYDGGIRYLARDWVPGDRWDAIILDELNNRRPIAYGGVTRRHEGHFFVLDGVDADGYYHINWGWSGMENGYYLLSLLEPGQQGAGGADSGEAFHYSQNMIVGIQKPAEEPSQAQYNYVCESLGELSSTLSRQSTAPLKAVGVWNNCANPSTVNLGFAMTDEEGNVVRTQWVKENKNYAIGYGEESLECSFIVPDDIPEGVYKVVPAFTVNEEGDGNVHFMPLFNGRADHYRAEVGVDKITWTLAGNYALTMLDVAADNGTIESGVSKSITVKVRNDGSDFHGPVQLRAFIKDKDKVFGRTDIPSKAMWVNIPAYSESEIIFTLPEKFSLPGHDNYVMRLWGNEGSFDEDDYARKPVNLCSKEGIKVIGPALPPVVSVADDIIVTTLSNGVVPKNDLGLKVYIENEGGAWSGQIQAAVFDPENWSDKPMGYVTFRAVEIEPECEMWLDLAGGEFPESCQIGSSYEVSLLNPADGDYMVPSYYTDLEVTVGEPVDKTPALSCSSVELNPAQPESGKDVTVTYNLTNSGYRYDGTMHFELKRAEETLFTSAETEVGIDRDEETSVIFNETLPKLKQADDYTLVLYDGETAIHTLENVTVKGDSGVFTITDGGIRISGDDIRIPGASAITVFTASGLMVKYAGSESIDIRDLSRGIYIISADVKGQTHTYKLVK